MNLNVAGLFRFALPGAIFLAFFYFCRGMPRQVDVGMVALWTASAVPIGALMYCISRQVIFPVIRYYFLAKLLQEDRAPRSLIKPSKLEVQRDLERWAFEAGPNLVYLSIGSRLREWGDQMQFLYTAALCCILAPLVEWIAPGTVHTLCLDCTWDLRSMLVPPIVGVLLMAIAIYSNRRAVHYGLPIFHKLETDGSQADIWKNDGILGKLPERLS